MKEEMQIKKMSNFLWRCTPIPTAEMCDEVAEILYRAKYRKPIEAEKKKYAIVNIGCDVETQGIFEFTEEQFEFLNDVFTELNTHSAYQCMPSIFIDQVKKGGEG